MRDRRRTPMSRCGNSSSHLTGKGSRLLAMAQSGLSNVIDMVHHFNLLSPK